MGVSRGGGATGVGGVKGMVVIPPKPAELQLREIPQKKNDLNYILDTPDRRKKQAVCHINMLKLFHRHQPTPVMLTTRPEDHLGLRNEWPLDNSETLSNLDMILNHLSLRHRSQLKDLIILRFVRILLV